MKALCGFGCPVMFLLVVTAVVEGDDDKIKATGRTVLAEHKDAVIRVQFAGFNAFKTDDKVEKRDFKGEATGTIISPNGLILGSPFYRPKL